MKTSSYKAVGMSPNTSDRPMTPVTVQSKPLLLSCGDKRECQGWLSLFKDKSRFNYDKKK